MLQASSGRSGKQQQAQNSPNLVQAFQPSSVLKGKFIQWRSEEEVSNKLFNTDAIWIISVACRKISLWETNILRYFSNTLRAKIRLRIRLRKRGPPSSNHTHRLIHQSSIDDHKELNSHYRDGCKSVTGDHFYIFWQGRFCFKFMSCRKHRWELKSNQLPLLAPCVELSAFYQFHEVPMQPE